MATARNGQTRPEPCRLPRAQEARGVGAGPPTLYVTVGLPAAGKTTLARRLEIEQRALRFTPDEWMKPLFGDSMADGKRNVLEGRFIATALSALRLGLNVVLDFGVWPKMSAQRSDGWPRQSEPNASWCTSRSTRASNGRGFVGDSRVLLSRRFR